ncbi:MAG: flavodoxin-dependent (E)-4-hydroxy-3-methylbut-2-enyl-diphosphate synthase [Bacilli bacterium]|jgi:(E)-4-hydroxy-3-methylbut-2-enyl-diphosphate synthase
MTIREQTKLVKNKSLSFGKSNKILIQSMCDFKTSDTKNVIKQINECAKNGADLMRISILDDDDVNTIKIIKKHVKIPLVADIHLDYKLAIKAIDNGIDKIRINPGNITKKSELINILNEAKKYDTIIRIGVNSGSMPKNIKGKNEATKIVNAALQYINFFEKNDFFKIVVSLKSSNPITTYEAYSLFSKKSKYPLHIGVTESGFDEIGIIRSVAGLSPLLISGIGNTIRISLTHNPIKEIETCKRLLHDLNLYKNYPTIISCPTCGRCMVNNTKELAEKTLNYCVKNKKYITVAIMGCVINGIGEGKNADIGLAGANDSYVIFKHGKILKTIKAKDALKSLYEEIDNF